MALSQGQLQPFADFIKKELGIVFEVHNFFQLEQRLDKIAQMMSLGSASEVCDLQAKSGFTGMLKQLLLDIATNNETLFFRDPKVFTVILNHVFENFRQNFPKDSTFKIWSTASSFGQEPYSLAMMADELIQKYPGHPPIEILATDISDTALQRASEGVYTQLEIQRGLSAPKLIKYFDKRDDGMWSIKPAIKRRVKFEKFNLLDPVPPYRTAHLIMCRYVLIYQEHDRKIEIMNRLVRALPQGGMFVLGASESGLGLTDALEQVAIDGCILYRKK